MNNDDIASHEKFLFTLEWLLAVVRRYSGQLRFALVHIDYENPKLLGETYGAKNASQRLDEVLHSVRKAFRKTDLVARDKTDIWILLPYSPDEEMLVDKVKYIIDAASQGGLDIVERDLTIFSLPDDSMESCSPCSAPEFLAYLKQNHIKFSRKAIALPANEA